MSIDNVLKRVQDNDRAALDRLIDWLRIPSVSTDPDFRDDVRRAAEWARQRLVEAGLDASLHETGTRDKPGHPVVWAHHPGPKDYNGPHVLFYGHYDVQPPDPLELWESPPFEPVVKPAMPGGPGERVVARGAVDDKGQVSSFLEALRAWKEQTGDIPIKLSILIEGEEESGSANLAAYVEANKAFLSTADVCVISDTGMPSPTQPAVTYGVRGLCYCEIILHAADQDLHSGLWGGRCPNPINELTRVLAQLHDADRRVAIPGFYDSVKEPSAEERAAWKRLGFDAHAALKKIGLGPEADVGEKGWTALEREWARPTCDVNGIYGGYTGKGAKTVIASSAGAKVSFRLVADQDPDDIARKFGAWLRERTPPGCRWEFHNHGGGAPAKCSTDSENLRACVRALKRAANVEPALIKSGGSIPVVGMMTQKLGVDTLMMGFGLEDDRVHSPNEKFELACWRMGMRAHAALIDEFSRMTKG